MDINELKSQFINILYRNLNKIYVYLIYKGNLLFLIYASCINRVYDL